MAIDPVPLLLAIGAALAVAFVGSAVFRRAHVPDILFLLVTGAVLGPLLGILVVGEVRDLLPFLAALAIITIIFDGALEVTPGQLRHFGVPAVGLSIVVMTSTTVLVGLAVHVATDLAWASSFLLGLCFGGAGIAIIVPLARRMDVSAGAMTVILLEAVTSDILVIVGMFIACTILASSSIGWPLGLELLLLVAIACATGPAAGWLWSRFLARWGEASNAYTATLAALLVVYAGTEAVHGSGALAVLLFGIVVGNTKGSPLQDSARRPVFGERLVAFHHEIVFFVRAAFFVSVGAVARWDLLAQPEFLATGLLIAVVVGACRAFGVAAVLRRSGLSPWDRAATALLFPMGLATAAVSVIPLSFGIAGGQAIVDYAAVVIVLTNLLGTLAVFVGSALRKQGKMAPAADAQAS